MSKNQQKIELFLSKNQEQYISNTHRRRKCRQEKTKIAAKFFIIR